MKFLGLEPTNRCNLVCRHCLRNRADPGRELPLAAAARILREAKTLGIRGVILTGGEVALYSNLGDLLRTVAAQDFGFTLITNGHRFREYVLPLLLEPEVKSHLSCVYLSIDGATAATHDKLRGKASFAAVMEAAYLCRNNQLPMSLKSAVSTINQEELPQLARLGEKLGAVEHAFILPLPTPNLIRENLLPPPCDYKNIASWIQNDLAGSVKPRVTVEGFAPDGVLLNCNFIMDFLNVDYQGNLILCCQLSHVTMGDGVPTRFGGELVADLKETSLKEGIIRQYRLAAKLMEDKLESHGNPPGLSQTPCHWCLYHFGKLEWLKDFPDSPWAQELLPNC